MKTTTGPKRTHVLAHRVWHVQLGESWVTFDTTRPSRRSVVARELGWVNFFDTAAIRFGESERSSARRGRDELTKSRDAW